jgi:transcriptional regulator with XRE-family HTH domain
MALALKHLVGESDPLEFGDFLRRTRQEKDYSLKDLAKELRTSKGYISLLERGIRPPPSDAFVKRIADAIEVAPDYLLMLSGFTDAYYRLRNALKSLDPEMNIPWRWYVQEIRSQCQKSRHSSSSPHRRDR